MADRMELNRVQAAKVLYLAGMLSPMFGVALNVHTLDLSRGFTVTLPGGAKLAPPRRGMTTRYVLYGYHCENADTRDYAEAAGRTWRQLGTTSVDGQLRARWMGKKYQSEGRV